MTNTTETSEPAANRTAETEGNRAPREIPTGSPWNAVEEAFLKRRSVRRYRKKQVPEHYIRRILEVARYAPSHGNCQPWKFIVVRDPVIIKGMEESVGQFLQGAVAPASSSDAPLGSPPPGLHPVPFRLLSQGPQDQTLGLFWDAPTVIFPALDMRGIGHPEIDLGIVGTNIVMAAYSLGLGTCWVGFAEMLNSTDWPSRLGIEEPYRLIDAIAVGFSAGDSQRNMIQRETHRISWFEDGKERTLY